MRILKIDPSNFGNYKENFAGILKKPNLFGVFSKGCGHCQNMKPQWNELTEKLSNEKCDGSVIELDSGVIPQIPSESIKNRIKGVPTILIIKNGKPIHEYSGDRSTEDMYNFCKKFLLNNRHISSKHISSKHKSSKHKSLKHKFSKHKFSKHKSLKKKHKKHKKHRKHKRSKTLKLKNIHEDSM